MKSLSRFFLVGLLFALLSGAAFGQNLCSSTVYDGAGVLGNQFSSVQNAASALVNTGADPHIITVSSLTGGTIDATILNIAKSCPEWQTADHRNVKSNIFVIAVAPTQRKMAVFPGTAYEKAFSSVQVDNIRTNFMGPRFKKGEWAEGLIAAAQQSTARLDAFKSEATAPVQNTTINQASAPTDLKGLWIFLWILGGIGLIVVVVFIVRAVQAAKQAKLNAQSDAVAARNSAADLVNSLSSDLAAADATQPGVKAAQSIFDTYSASYGRLSRNLSSDPSDDGLTTEAYQTLASQYQTIVDKLNRAQSYLSNPTVDPNARYTSSYSGGSSGVGPIGDTGSLKSDAGIPRKKHGHGHSHSHTTIIRETVQTPAPSNNDFATGLIVGEALSNNRSREEEYERPSRSSSDDDNSSSFSTAASSGSFGSSSSSSSDDDSSSSSSFSSSSSSSSFESSSSSSDWGSSSSSSDFGSSFSSDSFSSSGGGDSF